jgi:tRNA(fMet)-specific endonuclease VapC
VKYLLDTNILVHLVRDSPKAALLDQQFGLLRETTEIYISAVTKGELLSFAKQAGWGKLKIGRLYAILNNIPSIPIDGNSPLMEAYADLDAFSQGKHPEYHLPVGFTARNMGKNDLWIAATAFLMDVPLITTDQDFKHLHPNFIVVHQL